MPTSSDYDFRGLEPFLDIAREGLGDLVDGAGYFDTLADEVLFEYLYAFPNYPREVRSREAVMQLYSGYGRNMQLHGAGGLAVHPGADGRTLTLEYEVHGTAVRTGALYENRFASIVTIEKRKVVRWRDYMDSLAAWTALTARA